MQTEQSLTIMKALADRSRLAIVNSLLERAHYVEELAKRHALAPSTVSFHLRKLEKAGLITSRKEQYYVVVTANAAIFDTTLRQIVAAAPANKDAQEERIDAYRNKVLESFFRHGRLEKLPAQHKKRLIVLEQFAARFEPGRRYGEAEVTGVIAPLFADYCTIRRLLVDAGLIRREGASYWREEDDPLSAAVVLPTAPHAKEKNSMPKSDQRRQIKRTVKQKAPTMGIYQIRCQANGRIYVGASRNLDGERNSRLFQLRMGKVVFSRELQGDLEQYGAEAFEFSVLAVLKPPEAGEDVARALAALECAWLEKLQPFGEHGYNSELGYRRSQERLRERG
jgi:DNA-binding HxlR family transcriptional regulator